MVTWQGDRDVGSFQAAVLLPVNVCCANRRNVWLFLELRFTFEEGACTKVTNIERTFEPPQLFITTSFCHEMLAT